jgi:hypothetical protein
LPNLKVISRFVCFLAQRPAKPKPMDESDDDDVLVVDAPAAKVPNSV